MSPYRRQRFRRIVNRQHTSGGRYSGILNSGVGVNFFPAFYIIFLPALTLHSRGFALNHKTVQRLMKQLGLVCRVRMKKYRSYKGEVGKTAPNVLNRDFHADKPNQKWVTDVTECSLFGQKLYLSPILDLHNGYLVSYTISDRPVLSMVTTMLSEAFQTIPDGTGLILHSDQGWHYQHRQYQQMLKNKCKCQ